MSCSAFGANAFAQAAPGAAASIYMYAPQDVFA